jgi:phosphoheptose isomerase
MEYLFGKKSFNTAIETILERNFLLVGGNGGSAEQSNHFIAELTGTFEEIPGTYPAMSMSANTSEITSFANDLGYENIFVRYLQVFKELDPAVLFITTSGTSKNVMRGLEYLTSIGKLDRGIVLTGKAPSLVDEYGKSDLTILSAYYNGVAEIQECHMKILHDMARIIKQNR